MVAAADRLAITQPAVTTSLREFEEVLGEKLFDRSGRTLRLNAAGAVFQQMAGAGLAEFRRAQNAVRRVRLDTVKLSVGALLTAATKHVPRAAVAFRESHPNCVLRVSAGPNWLLLSRLREDSRDLVVGRMAKADPMKGLSFRQLSPEEVVAVVHPGHPLGDRLDSRRLPDFPLRLPPPGAVISTIVRSWLVSVGAPVTAGYETLLSPSGARSSRFRTRSG